MKLFILLTLGVFWAANGMGQLNPKLKDDNLSATILKEYLILENIQLRSEIESIERSTLPLPYNLGDSFIIKDTLVIMNHYSDSTVIFDLDEGSYVPPGYNIKLMHEIGDMYFVECKNNQNDIRNGFVLKENLQDYFTPSNIRAREGLYKTLKMKDEKLKKYITKKYNISTMDLMSLIENARYRLRDTR